MKLIKKTNQSGFTLIELMLAMTLFISVMIVATVGFVGINRTFSKGLVRKQLSETVQRLTEDMTTTINNEGGLDSTNSKSENGKVCSQLTCYVWTPYQTDDEGSPGLYKVALGDVDVAGQPDTKKVTIADERYKVDKFSVVSIGGGLYRVTGIIRTKDLDAFEIADPLNYPANGEIFCKGSAQDGASQNCALEKFSFVVREN